VSTYEDRRERLRSRLAAIDADVAVVTRLVNVRYLTGFTGSNAALLVAREGEALLATDGRYTEQAAEESPDLALLVSQQITPALVAAAAERGVGRIAFEARDVTVELFDVMAEAAGTAELVRLGPAVEDLRRLKDEGELALLREACAVGDRALAELIPWLRVGLTEREIARRLDDLMLDNGGDGRGFDTIVAAGPNSSIPHHQPTSRTVERGDFLKLDFGSLYRGYHADMTRTLVVGGEPADWQRETYELVARAQAAGRDAVRVGAALADVDRAARTVIEDAGLGAAFAHGLGHGVGLEIHEDPFLASSGTGTLDLGVPLTVEPGVYLAGRGGVRIEDTVVVTAGAPELLTTTTKELLVVG